MSQTTAEVKPIPPAAPDPLAPDTTPPTPDDPVRRVIEWFGLDRHPLPPGRPLPRPTHEPDPDVVAAALPHPGELALITGGSGSGKSTLLRRVVDLARARGLTVLTPDSPLPEVPLVCLFDGEPVERVVARLAWTGLGEPATLLRTPATLSDGERFRLRLALALRAAGKTPGPVLLACDEFASTLDDGSAVACARTLRRAVSACPGVAAALASWRDELSPHLAPDLTLHCDYGLWQLSSPHGPRPTTSIPTPKPRLRRLPPTPPNLFESPL